MTFKAKRAHVGQIAFASSFCDWGDVICVPEGFAFLHAPIGDRFQSGRSTHAFYPAQFSHAVEAAKRANAGIAFENTLAEVCGIATQLPFLHAPVRAKGEAALRYFQVAPAAKCTTVFAGGQIGAIDQPTGHRAISAHTQ